jgi:hypothetical protein
MLEKRGQKGKFFRRQKFALLLKRRKIKLSQGAEIGFKRTLLVLKYRKYNHSLIINILIPISNIVKEKHDREENKRASEK